MIRTLGPQDWGLRADSGGALMIEKFRVVDLARRYGTPLHIIHETRLEQTALHFRRAFAAAYPGRTSVHFAFKCNSVPAVVRTVRRAGLEAEVMSEFELDLALHLGYQGRDIVVNGPGKSAAFLKRCLESDVRLISVDSLSELELLRRTTEDRSQDARILLRINPNHVPRGMNSGTATGSRKGCAFGLDLQGGEAERALAALKGMKRIRFYGYHFHIGTGIREPKEYSRALERLAPLIGRTRRAGFEIKVMDVGGGFASMTTRELTTGEFLIYQGLGRMPSGLPSGPGATFEDFGREIAGALTKLFSEGEMPELIVEPGRCIASPNQVLLLTVRHVKTRPGVRTWVITDGGLGTVTLPTFYEYHEVFLADDVARPRTQKVTIVGSGCFASDIVYRNKPMPAVHPGEIIAICDSGAYFTAQESSFGFPRPAVIAVDGTGDRLVRRRETFEDMIDRDRVIDRSENQEDPHEICRHQD